MATKIKQGGLNFLARLVGDLRQLVNMPYTPKNAGDAEKLVPKVYIMIDSSVLSPDSTKTHVLSQNALNVIIRRIVITMQQAGAEAVVTKADTNVTDVQLNGSMAIIPPKKTPLNAKAVDEFVEEIRDNQIVAGIVLITDGTFRNIQTLQWTGEPYMHRRLFIIGTPDMERDVEELTILLKKTGMRRKEGEEQGEPNFKSQPVYIMSKEDMNALDANAEEDADVKTNETDALKEGIERKMRERSLMLELDSGVMTDLKMSTSAEQRQELGPAARLVKSIPGLRAEKIGSTFFIMRNAEKDGKQMLDALKSNKIKTDQILAHAGDIDRQMAILKTMGAMDDIIVLPAGNETQLLQFIRNALFKKWAANKSKTIDLMRLAKNIGHRIDNQEEVP